MKGWVYVISNISMQGIVKVGYSTKDPELRAEELNHTGAPHPYLVDYDMLVENPREVEQKAHKILRAWRENKEWFCCSTEEAIAAIKQAADGAEIVESYKRAERERAESLYQDALNQQELERQQSVARQELAARLEKETAAIRAEFDEKVSSCCPPRPFWQCWLLGGVIVLVLLGIVAPKTSDGAVLVGTTMGGILPGLFLQHFFEIRRKQSAVYRTLEQQRDQQLADLSVS